MVCCNILPPPVLECSNNFEQETKTMWLHLNNKIDRKAIKLLVRQYEIQSVRRDPPEYHDHIIVRENPIIISYWHYSNPTKVFEWVIEPDKFKIWQ